VITSYVDSSPICSNDRDVQAKGSAPSAALGKSMPTSSLAISEQPMSAMANVPGSDDAQRVTSTNEVPSMTSRYFSWIAARRSSNPAFCPLSAAMVLPAPATPSARAFHSVSSPKNTVGAIAVSCCSIPSNSESGI
jgi:hypothetical protein